MSVLIKGMDMPKACERCRFISTFSTECGLGCRCEISNSEFWDYTKRQDNCPLIEIPTPHGRLIDADAACKKYKDEVLLIAELAYRKIRNAPTIIEAEE